jgi:hypothetical protein
MYRRRQQNRLDRSSIRLMPNQDFDDWSNESDYSHTRGAPRPPSDCQDIDDFLERNFSVYEKSRISNDNDDLHQIPFTADEELMSHYPGRWDTAAAIMGPGAAGGAAAANSDLPHAPCATMPPGQYGETTYPKRHSQQFNRPVSGSSFYSGYGTQYGTLHGGGNNYV